MLIIIKSWRCRCSSGDRVILIACTEPCICFSALHKQGLVACTKDPNTEVEVGGQEVKAHPQPAYMRPCGQIYTHGTWS